jgi:hypothetical protein
VRASPSRWGLAMVSLAGESAVPLGTAGTTTGQRSRYYCKVST